MSSPSAGPLGQTRPRVEAVPPAARDEAADAAFLATSYGLRPDPWQEHVLAGWLGVRPDGMWSSPRCGLSVPRQNGKNGALEVRELFGMIELGERILHTAHEVKTARKAFARLLEFFDNPRAYPELNRLVREIRKTNGQEAIVLHGGGQVEFIARSKGSGRGFSADVLVMDEAQELSEDAYAALRPTISASANPQEILTGTPPGPTAVGEVFTRTRTAGVGGLDPRLCWHEYGCDVGFDIYDDALLAQANPAAGIRLGWETIADERSGMSPDTFARERGGVWVEPESRLAAVNIDAWSGLAGTLPQITHPVFGVATGPDAAWCAVVAAWVGPGGLVCVEITGDGQQIDYRPGTSWVAPRLRRLLERWGGTVVLDVASRGLWPDGVKPSLDAQAQAHNGFADRVLTGGLRHGNEGAMNVAARSARWKTTGESRSFERKGDVDISPLRAAALAVHSLTTDGGPSVYEGRGFLTL